MTANRPERLPGVSNLEKPGNGDALSFEVAFPLSLKAFALKPPMTVKYHALPLWS